MIEHERVRDVESSVPESFIICCTTPPRGFPFIGFLKELLRLIKRNSARSVRGLGLYVQTCVFCRDGVQENLECHYVSATNSRDSTRSRGATS